MQLQSNHLASLFCPDPLFSFFFLGRSPVFAAHFVHFYAIRAVTEMVQDRKKTKREIYNYVVLNITTGFHILYFPHLNPPKSPLRLQYTSSCNFQMQNLNWSRHRCETVCPPPSLLAIPLLRFSPSQIFCLLGQADKWRVRG